MNSTHQPMKILIRSQTRDESWAAASLPLCRSRILCSSFFIVNEGFLRSS